MFKVAALYQFAALPDFAELREPLRVLCAGLNLRGSVLLAEEGINGTVAGTDDAIDALVAELTQGALFGGRLDRLELKFSRASAMPFLHLKIRLKKEIVTLGAPHADPTRQVGTYVDPADWNAVMADDDTLLLDTRNAFEVAMGTFEGAVDPQIKSFGQFKDFVARTLDPAKHRKIAMFCTGGIRCEKASSYLLAQGFAEVFHLKGGILKYLEQVPERESRWRGDCFVFDGRIALGHGLKESQSIAADAPINSDDFDLLHARAKEAAHD
ncbi:oxygen-dependent tRNA uridine(34) hydroxylase TrhO [Rhodopseudomonas sp. P2A-2r]|uniref:oxygen-dependent tRNA uridine(34) hydroxylase TrhO n=1 Tax=unclassified Rhodopseudomonas TaxID=2638247 RepID=UPI00223424CE|nr:rhodanese-related sulfurtransferase [Rhodopseudomonas sp. P2A-2r]UZE48887.1 rhodanese-related sulfurtransferase [Rhodopseudomonas sp. P2A-2r]